MLIRQLNKRHFSLKACEMSALAPFPRIHFNATVISLIESLVERNTQQKIEEYDDNEL